MSFEFDTNISIPEDVVESIAEFVKEDLDISGRIETVMETISRYDGGIGQAIYSFCEDAVDNYMDNYDYASDIEDLKSRVSDAEENIEDHNDSLSLAIDTLRGQVEILQQKLEQLLPSESATAENEATTEEVEVTQAIQEIDAIRMNPYNAFFSPDFAGVVSVVNKVVEDIKNNVTINPMEYWYEFVNTRSTQKGNAESEDSE